MSLPADAFAHAFARAFARAADAPPLIFGHRGTRRGAPENTLGAMRMALDQGADGIELDVRLCRGGEVIVLHDPDLLRVANAQVVAADASYAQLCEHDLGQGERIPLLSDALALVLGRGALLNVELKEDVPDAAALVAAVVDTVERVLERVAAGPAGVRERLVFSSFSGSICSALQAALPQTPDASPIALLHGKRIDAGPAGMRAIHPRHGLIDAATVAQLHAQGLVVNVWTVNEPDRARELSAAGVDGIITDDVPGIRGALGLR